MNEIKDLLECIAKFDKTENLETKGRYFETVQKDAERLVKLFTIPNIVGRSEQLSCSTCKWLKRDDDYCDTCFKFCKHEKAT